MSTCIVTGSSAGNGLAIARQLMFDGHYVIGVDRVEHADGDYSQHVTGDVCDPKVIERAFANALVHGSREVYLVNNAGITIPESPQSDEAWDRTLEVNLAAPFKWAREFSEHVTAGRITDGGIVFIGSLATLMGFPGNPAYQASKAGLTGLARAFAVDLGGFGIRSNSVSPGYIHTAMTSRSYETPELNAARKRHMLLRRWGRPEDVANAVSFLCSSRSSYITGINLPVDGGWLACGLTE